MWPHIFNQEQNFFTTFAFLYSDDRDLANVIESIKKMITNDDKLKKLIHIINVDNRMIRNWLTYNESGCVIKQFPIFVVRRAMSHQPEIYKMEEYATVFELCHEYHEHLVKQLE